MAPRRSRTPLAPAAVQAGDLAIDAGGLAPGDVARLLDARDRVLAGRGIARSRDDAALEPIMLVRLGETRVGVPLAAVAAILPPVRAALVPGAPPQLIGLFAHDGAIHNLFAVEAALGLPPPAPRGEAAALVLRRPAPRIAIAIDEAVGLVRIARPAGDTAADDGSPLRFVAGEGEAAIVLVDVERLVAALAVGGTAAGQGETN